MRRAIALLGQPWTIHTRPVLPIPTKKKEHGSHVHLCRRGQPIYTHAGAGGRHGGWGDSPVLIVDKTPKFKEMTREGMGKRIWKWKSRERKRPGEKK